MPAIDVLLGSAIAVLILVLSACISLLAARISALERQTEAFVTNLSQIIEGGSLHQEQSVGHHDWPAEAGVQPGSRVPRTLTVGTVGTEWRLLILLRDGCGHCDAVREALGDLQRQLMPYRIEAIQLDDHEETRAIPAPSVVSVDPMGMVMGCGRIERHEEILAFVFEGMAAGIGPPALHNTTTPQRF